MSDFETYDLDKYDKVEVWYHKGSETLGIKMYYGQKPFKEEEKDGWAKAVVFIPKEG